MAFCTNKQQMTWQKSIYVALQWLAKNHSEMFGRRWELIAI